MSNSNIIRPINYKSALNAVVAAVEHGINERNVKVVACVVDIGGHLVASLRADGAFIASNEIAKDKAYTGAVFGISTDTLQKALSSNAALEQGIAKRDGVVLFGGGFPIIEDGQLIGGIGISGGSEDDDRECAKAGLKAIGL